MQLDRSPVPVSPKTNTQKTNTQKTPRRNERLRRPPGEWCQCHRRAPLGLRWASWLGILPWCG